MSVISTCLLWLWSIEAVNLLLSSTRFLEIAAFHVVLRQLAEKTIQNFDRPSIRCFSTTLGSTALANSLATRPLQERVQSICSLAHWHLYIHHFSMFRTCGSCPWRFVDFTTTWKKQAVQVSRDGCWLSSASLGHTVGSGQCHSDNQSHVVTTSRCQSSQPAYLVQSMALEYWDCQSFLLKHWIPKKLQPFKLFGGNAHHHLGMFQTCGSCPWKCVDFATAWRQYAVQISWDLLWWSCASWGNRISSGQCHSETVPRR